MALAYLLLTLSSAASAEFLDESSDRIASLCHARDAQDEGCQCLALEAGSRFEPDQLQMIATAMEAGVAASQIAAHLQELGMTTRRAESFAHRLNAAHIVIQQTCDTSFLVSDKD